jgi:hypothetical protein
MNALLTIAGVILVIFALRRLSRIFTVSEVGVFVLFGLGLFLAFYRPLFLTGVAIAASLFLWWLLFRFLWEWLTGKHGFHAD